MLAVGMSDVFCCSRCTSRWQEWFSLRSRMLCLSGRMMLRLWNIIYENHNKRLMKMLTVSWSNIYLICPYIALVAVHHLSHRRNEDIKFTFGADLQGLSFPHHPSYCWRLERQDAINQCLLFCSVERLWVTHLPNGLLWPGAYLTGIGPAS